MKTAASGGGLKIWSVGNDAIDDGGSGEWESKGKDVILEVKRK